ncbi:MAG: ABC transporter substrate-binding protein [Candidatus Promineifilaceae bacterium]|nr:ABC transporter substrate-binding protein [Candidatus Promineifilaceae bacterium]
MLNTLNKIPKFRTVAIVVALLLSLFVSACSAETESARVRLALLPIMDALPLYVAEEQGYFAEENLIVEFVPVSSAPARDQLIQAGEADGMVNEILSTMFYNVDSVEVVTLRYARKATPEFPHFYVLASAASDLAELDDLNGQEIGISQATVIEYTTDRLLAAEGVSSTEYSKVAVPSIPDRLALLNSGELAAANMPDPLAALAIQNGARVLVDDSAHPQYGHSVITFRKDFVEENPDVIRRFLQAVENAVQDINTDKSQFAEVLSARQLVPEPLLVNYTIPDFPEAAVPTEAQWQDVLDWAMARGYLASELDYEVSVDDSFLP